MSSRVHQINSLIKDTVGPILFKLVDQEDFGLITITHVVTVPNLDSSKIWVSAMKNEDKLLGALNKLVYEIQQNLNQSVSLRKVPRIIFKLDDSSSYVAKIDQILKETGIL